MAAFFDPKRMKKIEIATSAILFSDVLELSMEDKLLMDNKCEKADFKYMTYSEYINSPFGKFRADVV